MALASGLAALQVDVSGQGRDLFLLAGVANGPAVWDGVLSPLSGRVRMHRVSLAGFAGMAAVDVPLLPAAQEQLAIAVAACEQPAVLVAHSLGCYLAYRLAAERPEHVAAVIAVDGPPAMGEWMFPQLTGAARDREIAHRAEEICRLSDVSLPQRFGASLLQMAGSAHLPLLMDMVVASEPRVIGEAMLQLWSSDLRSMLGRVQAPVLAVLPSWPGMASALVDERHRQHREQLAGLADCEVVIIDDARHYVMLDQPAAFDAAVVDFLERRLWGRS